MKPIMKKVLFKLLIALLCSLGCVSVGLNSSAANATRKNGVTRHEAITEFPQGRKIVPFSASGRIARANGVGVGGVTVTFGSEPGPGRGRAPGSVVTNADGRWTQSGFESGTTYTASAGKPGFTFQPPTRVFGRGRTGLDFDGTTDPFSFSGTVTTSFTNIGSGRSGEVGVSGATISFARVLGPGRVPTAVTTDSSGHWTESGFEGDTVYRASPNKPGFDFNPTSAEFRNVKPVTELKFEGRSNTFTASGRVTALQGGLGIGGVMMTFSVVSAAGPAQPPVLTDSQGRWSQSGFKNNTRYEVTPTHPRGEFAFDPGGRQFAFSDARRTALNFDALNVMFSLSGKAVIFNGTTPPIGPPIPGVTITFSLPGEPRETAPPPVTTDAQGKWHQSGFKKGKSYSVNASKPNFTIAQIYSTVRFPNFSDSPGEMIFALERNR